MKKTLLCSIITLFICSLSMAQNKKVRGKKIKYFDENYQSISKVEYQIRSDKYGFLRVEGDSIHHKILSVRGNSGSLENRAYLDSLLTLATKKKIDSTKPLVIIFHPGKDPCNSSGTATRQSTRMWYNEMEKGIHKIKQSNIIYVYKTDQGLFGRNDGYKEWIKDPDQIIEELFFKRHYPCSSFVVIAENSDFISSFGESSKEYIWNTVEILTKK